MSNENRIDYNENREHKEEECPMNHGFCCPKEIPAYVPDTRLSSPNKCPRKILTKRFSSPTSGLPQKKLEELRRFMEETNQLLSALSNPRNPNNLAGLRVRFRMLRGILVRVEFECGDKKLDEVGLLKDAGRDFLKLDQVGKVTFIPFIRICKIERNNCEDMMEENMGHKELIDIDPCLRRNLVLNFGNTVSQNPELINIFFGIPLFLELAKFIGCRVKIKTEGEETPIKGELVDTKLDKICLKVDEEIRQINIADICSLTI